MGRVPHALLAYRLSADDELAAGGGGRAAALRLRDGNPAPGSRLAHDCFRRCAQPCSAQTRSGRPLQSGPWPDKTAWIWAITSSIEKGLAIKDPIEATLFDQWAPEVNMILSCGRWVFNHLAKSIPFMEPGMLISVSTKSTGSPRPRKFRASSASPASTTPNPESSNASARIMRSRVSSSTSRTVFTAPSDAVLGETMEANASPPSENPIATDPLGLLKRSRAQRTSFKTTKTNFCRQDNRTRSPSGWREMLSSW